MGYLKEDDVQEILKSPEKVKNEPTENIEDLKTSLQNTKFFEKELALDQMR